MYSVGKIPGGFNKREGKASEKSVQDMTDKFIKQIDAAATKKQSEVMAI